MNVVPFDPAPLVRGAFRAAPAGFAADAAYNLARQYGPRLANYALRNFGRLGMRAAREAWRRWGPRPQTFMDRARLALGRAQRTAVRRHIDRLARRAPRVGVKSQDFSQIRRGTRGFNARSRGVNSVRRGAMVGRRRYPMRTGGRYVNSRGIRPELKAYDIGVVSQPITNVISLMYGPWQTLSLGVTASQRIGRKVRVKSIVLTGRIHSDVVTTVSNAADTVWLWVVMDRQPNNNTPSSPTEIWSNATAATALRNLDQGPRFKIIKCIEIKTDFGQSGTRIDTPFEAYIPLDTVVTWQGEANSSPFKNNLLLYIGNSNVSGSELKCSMISRVRYVDY